MGIDEASYGPNHPNVAVLLNNLAQLLQDTNRMEDAEPLMRRHFEIFMVFQKQEFQLRNIEQAQRNYISLLEAQGLTEPEIQAKLQSLQPPPPAP